VEYIFLVMCSLGAITAFFAYLFLFRLPTSQINAQMGRDLQALYNDTAPDKEHTTLLLRCREIRSGELSGLVVWLEGLEQIDPTRQILAKAFEQYADAAAEGVLWHMKWEDGDYDDVKKASREAFTNRVKELEAQGWQVVFDLPFSLIDHLLYLERQKP